MDKLIIFNMLSGIFNYSKIYTDYIDVYKNKRVMFDFVVPDYGIVVDCEAKEQNKAYCVDNRLTYYGSSNIIELRNFILDRISTIEIKRTDNMPLLIPHHAGDAGYDIICNKDTDCPPKTNTDIPSGLFMAMPNHIYGIVQARSSASKKKLIVLPGVIDSGYRGEVYAMIYNLSDEHVIINKGSSIAQLLFMYRFPNFTLKPVDHLPKSDRQSAGFGSTGNT